MSEELISKKVLLQEMNISYGQLYRWKRKKLIPEEWFIKKSVFTGQETFFPKVKIMDRITKILELKDEVSLDKLAEQFSCNLSELNISRDDLVSLSVIPNNIINIFEKNIIKKEEYGEKELFSLFLYEKLLNSGKLNIDEVNEVVLSVFNGYNQLKEENNLLIKRKFGVLFYYVLDRSSEVIKDEAAVEVFKIEIKEILENISIVKG